MQASANHPKRSVVISNETENLRMKRDTQGLILALIGFITFVVGIVVLLDLVYYHTFAWLRTVPVIGVIVPNLVIGGYALIEVGRYFGTKGETQESRYFGDRLSLASGGDPTDIEPTDSTATALWFALLWVGITGQVIWGLLALTGMLNSYPRQVLRYTSLLLTVLAAHYDMEYVGKRVSWPGPQRWTIGFVVFPLNHVVAVVYVWVRRQRLSNARSPSTNGDKRTDAADSVTGPTWIQPEWHYLVGCSMLGWVLLLLDPVEYLAIIVLIWLTLPLSIFLDTRTLSSSGWTPKRYYWIVGAIVPPFNLTVGAVYLLRRYETTSLRLRTTRWEK